MKKRMKIPGLLEPESKGRILGNIPFERTRVPCLLCLLSWDSVEVGV